MTLHPRHPERRPVPTGGETVFAKGSGGGQTAVRHRRAVLLAALLLLIPTPYFLFPIPSEAQTPPTVTDGGVQATFPDRLAFSVSATSDSPIEKIRLRYSILPDGTGASGVPDFDPSTSVTASFELQGPGQTTLYLPPGTTLEYHWQVTDADGDEATTETATFFYNDQRFEWTPLEGDGVTVYSYSGSDRDAQAMLLTATEILTSMSDLLGTSIEFPVKIWLYESVEDMRPALQRRSETYEQSVVTAGVRVASDTVLVLGTASFGTLRHELTHVVTAVAGEGPFGTMPAWLDEGTAVYGQDDPGGFEGAINRAVDRGNVLSVRSITSYPGDPGKVDLFYGESWSLVKFLNDTYGPDKFAQLFAEIKSGKRIDAALDAVYGFDQDGLEDEWRAALGLPPRPTPELTDPAQPSLTEAPSTDQPSTESEDGGTSTGVVAGIAIGTLALAGGIGAIGWAVARKYR